MHATLDNYSTSWTELHTRTCEAHRAGERSGIALDLQMHCLQRRRSELKALVDVFAEADHATVTNATQAASGLVPVASCSDPAALLEEQQRLGLPKDPATAARVQQLRYRLARIEALFWRGRLLIETGALAEAANALWQAYLTGLLVGHESIAARSLITDVFVQGNGLQKFDAAERSFEIAEVLITRGGPKAAYSWEHLNNLALTRDVQGLYTEAELLYQEQLRRLRREAPNSSEVAYVLNNLGLHYSERGQLEKAEAALREALLAFEDKFGARHLWTHMAQANLAIVYFKTGNDEEAAHLILRSLPAITASVSRDRPDLADLFAVSGMLQLRRGAVTSGLAELEHAYALSERSGRRSHRAFTHFLLAQALWEHEPTKRERALALARQARRDAGAIRDVAHQQEIARWLDERAPTGSTSPTP